MKAVITKRYGAPDVLVVEEVEVPKVANIEVLIKVHAASLNSGDVRMRSLDAGKGLKGLVSKQIIRLLLGIKKPRRIPGSVLAGEIVKIGASVTDFKEGDEIFAMTGFSFGAFAEYCALPVKRAIALKPKRTTYQQACALPFGGNTALHFLRKAGIGSGQSILIYGSTGSVGTSAVQIACHLGAKVTAVCGPNGMELSKKLGATTVYNYQTTTLNEIADKYDIVFDAVGKISKSQAAHLLKKGGRYITINGLEVAKETTANLQELATMYDNGVLVACIDRSFKLEQIVEANRYVDEGHKKGNVVITIAA